MYDNKNINVILIYLILKEFSDSEHYLSWDDITNLLRRRFGVEVDRKLVGRNLELLQDAGFDITPKSNGRGTALIERQLDTAQIDFIVSTLINDANVDQRTLIQIIENLISDHSKYERRELKERYNLGNLPRTKSRDVLINMNTFLDAISKKKRLMFNTIAQKPVNDSERAFELVPYAIIINKQRFLALFKTNNEEDARAWFNKALKVMNGHGLLRASGKLAELDDAFIEDSIKFLKRSAWRQNPIAKRMIKFMKENPFKFPSA